jgi:large subunit ribosomal protein L3
MRIGFFAKKVGMTRLFDNNQKSIPVTLVKLLPAQVNQIKTMVVDGYNAVQIAYNDVKPENLDKPQKGSLKKKGSNFYGEFRVTNPEKYSCGQPVDIDVSLVGKRIRVTSMSYGKGFSGLQRRWNFSRGLMTHGSKNHRLPGSIGAGTTPGRVYPGKKMAGQLGRQGLTSIDTEIHYLSLQEGLVVLKGSIPGANYSVLKIQPVD